MPDEVDPANRDHRVVFIGRHDPRKGLPTLLRAWPRVHAATGARLRLIGTDPLQYRLLHTRLRVDDAGIDVLGIVTNEVRTEELMRAKVSVTPALGGESFGLVLAEAFACATPAVASDIPGYAAVATPEAAVLVPPERPGSARRGDPRRARRRGPARRDGARRTRARARELRMGRHRAAVGRDLRRGCRVSAGGTRAGTCSSCCRSSASPWGWSILRGPDWHLVQDAFTVVSWEWVVVAIALNLLSVITRSLSWNTAVKESMPPPHPSYPLVFSAFCVGLFANAMLPGRVGELARVAVLSRRMPGRSGTAARLVGSVFAHRMFDVFPAIALVVWVLLEAKIPRWAYLSIEVALGVGIVLFVVAVLLARMHQKDAVEGVGRMRLLLGRAHGRGSASCGARRQLRRPPRSSSRAGRASCWPCGRRCSPSTSTNRSSPPGSCSC